MNCKFSTTPFRNTRLYWLALAGTMSLFTASAAVAEITEQFDFQPGQVLSLDFSDGGSVHIEGWDRSGIEVTYDDEHGVERHDVQFESSAEGMNITARLRNGYNYSGLSFYFKVPRELMLETQSGGGVIEIEGVDGDFVGRTGGGAITLKDISGNVDLTTGGGRVLVQDSDIDGKVRTGGGKVLVEDVTGNFRATSGGGEVRYRNVHSPQGDVVSPSQKVLKEATGDTVLISNAGGGIKVDSAPDGADVYTGGGKIRISDANRFVAAKTGGGDVDIEMDEGWIDASTGAGDVEIDVLGSTTGKGDIKVITGHGDVTLTLPSNFSMDLLVEIGVTNNTRKKYSVTSDFDIETEVDDEWDYSHGTPRKFTIGSASLNGGDHLVHIRTTNGNVEIKKGN